MARLTNYERYVSKGLCVTGCGSRIALTSKSRCGHCLIKIKMEYDAKGKAKCVKRCGRLVAAGSKSRCTPCLVKVRENQRTYQQHGLCTQGCGRDLVSKSRCGPCLEKLKQSKIKRVAQMQVGAHASL